MPDDKVLLDINLNATPQRGDMGFMGALSRQEFEAKRESQLRQTPLDRLIEGVKDVLAAPRGTPLPMMFQPPTEEEPGETPYPPPVSIKERGILESALRGIADDLGLSISQMGDVIGESILQRAPGLVGAAGGTLSSALGGGLLMSGAIAAGIMGINKAADTLSGTMDAFFKNTATMIMGNEDLFQRQAQSAQSLVGMMDQIQTVFGINILPLDDVLKSFIQSVQTVTDQLDEAAKTLAPFSPALSAQMAAGRVAAFERQMRAADVLGEDLSEFVSIRQQQRALMEDMQVTMTKAFLPLINDIQQSTLSTSKWIADLIGLSKDSWTRRDNIFSDIAIKFAGIFGKADEIREAIEERRRKLAGLPAGDFWKKIELFLTPEWSAKRMGISIPPSVRRPADTRDPRGPMPFPPFPPIGRP